MDKFLWDHREFKMFDKVIMKDTGELGVIDAMPRPGEYGVELIGKIGYEWVSRREIKFADKQKQKNEPQKKSINLDYLG